MLDCCSCGSERYGTLFLCHNLCGTSIKVLRMRFSVNTHSSIDCFGSTFSNSCIYNTWTNVQRTSRTNIKILPLENAFAYQQRRITKPQHLDVYFPIVNHLVYLPSGLFWLDLSTIGVKVRDG